MTPEELLRVYRECRELAGENIVRYLKCVDERVSNAEEG